jgi:hypothetical protein
MDDRRPRSAQEYNRFTSENSPQLSTKESNSRYPSRSLRTTPPNNHPSQPTAQIESAQKSNTSIGAMGSKKSALDIENDLFAGIKTEAPEPEDFSKESPDMIHSLVSAFGRDFLGTSESTSISDATSFTASHTKLIQPLYMPQKVVRSTLAEIRKAENNRSPTAAKVTTIPQFQFMSRAAPSEVEAMKKMKEMKEMEQQNIDASMFDTSESRVRRVESSEWTSSSRESWDYETIVEQEPEEDPEMMKAALESYLTAEQERILKKKELSALKKRAKAARFKLSIADLAHWEPEVHKTEAPIENTSQNTLYIPPSISVVNFSNLLKVSLGTERL